MLVRHCLIVAIGPDSALLRAEPGTCEGCVGCAGRCSVLPAGNAEIRIALADIEGCIALGGRATLSLPDVVLRNEALRGYGLPLLGLMLGALLGFGLAGLLSLPVDIATAIGAGAGTLLSLHASKSSSKPICRMVPLPAANS